MKTRNIKCRFGIKAVSLAAMSGTLFALPWHTANAAEIPQPLVRYDAMVSGTSIVPNTGTLPGRHMELRSRESSSTAFASQPLTDDMIGEDGTGPAGNGGCIDFSAVPAHGGLPDRMGGMSTGFDVFYGLSELTITLWYRVESPLTESAEGATGTQRILFRTNGVRLFFNNYTYLRAIIPSDTGTTDFSQQTTDENLTQVGKWAFIAVTWNGATGNASLYGGTETLAAWLLRSYGGNPGIIPSTPSTYINFGFYNISAQASGGALDGKLADVRVYNKALTMEEIEGIRAARAVPPDRSYKGMLKKWVNTELTANYTEAKVTALCPPGGQPNDRLSQIAAVAARMWVLEGKNDNSYADRAYYILNALRGQWAATPTWEIGFQAKFAFLEAYRILLQNGYTMDEAFKTDMKAIAAANHGPGGDDIGDNNRAAFEEAGTVQALALWPDLDEGGKWTERVRQHWASWATLHDSKENSLNYNKLFWPMTVLMAERAADVASLAGDNMLADLNHASTRAMLTRFRDQVTGSGQMPWYGDAGNGTPSPDMDCWPATFEWAAKQYNDPTFRWSALTVWQLLRDSPKRIPLNLFILSYALEWTIETLEPAQPEIASALLTRNTRWSATDPDKIILAPSRNAGAPFWMAEVFAHGTHSHKEQTGSISLYEYKNTVYLHTLGYNNRASDQASMVLINRADSDFPWRSRPQNNTWYEAAIPTSDFPQITDPTDPLYGPGGLHILDRPEWRFEQRHPTETGLGYVSNFRLISKDGTETLLNAMNDASDWSAGATVTQGPTPEMSALQFTIRIYDSGDAPPTVARTPKAQALGRAIDPAEHPYMKFWWKADCAAPFDDQIIMLRDRYPYDNQLSGDYAWLQPFTPATTAAKVESSEKGRYGSFTLDGYMTPKTQLSRRMVQIDNGAMFVMDTLVPDADANGRIGGPVWQIASGIAPVEVAPGIFDAANFYNTEKRAVDTDHLLLVMEQSDGRSFGSNRPPAPLWDNVNPYATYAKQTLVANTPVSFLSVLVPSDGSVSAATLAAKIRMNRTSPTTADIFFDNDDGTTMKIVFGENDTWSVTQIPTPQPATVTLSDLEQQYDGLPKSATVTTNPAGLPVWVTYNSGTTLPIEEGAYAVMARITGDEYYGESSGTFMITPPVPHIRTQPISRVAYAGQSVSFTVDATGEQPLTYKWEKSTDDGVTFSAVGTNAPSLQIASAQASDAGLYRVTITNVLDPVGAVSNNASLAVVPAPFPSLVPDGAASGITGGGTAEPILVNTAEEFVRLAVSEQSQVIIIQGIIDLSAMGGIANIVSDKTIQGLDGNTSIIGGLKVADGSGNVIIRGLNITNANGNGLELSGAHDVFVTHCTFFDCGENLVSIINGSDRITLSWSEFYYTTAHTGQRAAMSVGKAGVEARPINVTLHHNWWSEGCGTDMPASVYGHIHMYNNYLLAPGNSAATIVSELSQLMSAHNVYQDMNNPLYKQQVDAGQPAGLIWIKDDIFVNPTGTAVDSGTDAVFVPKYSHVLRTAENVALLVNDYAGNTNGAASSTPSTPGAAIITGPDAVVQNNAEFTLNVTATGFAPTSYQWNLKNAGIAGATESAYTVANANKADHEGDYSVDLGLSTGEIIVSAARTLLVGEPQAPTIITQPASQTTGFSGDVSFTVVAAGDPPLSYQWQKGTLNIAGETSPTLNLHNIQQPDGGGYRVIVSNTTGSVTSTEATLTVAGTMSMPEAGGGGGGAVSTWMFLALSALVLLRSVIVAKRM